jgi:hypothetical protein
MLLDDDGGVAPKLACPTKEESFMCPVSFIHHFVSDTFV